MTHYHITSKHGQSRPLTSMTEAILFRVTNRLNPNLPVAPCANDECTAAMEAA